jgi:hypothetical protein
MIDFVTLTCPNCGGKLEITIDIKRFACSHCGNEHVVTRGSGIVSIIPISDEIKKTQTCIDKTAAELEILRLKIEIYEIEQKNKSLPYDILKKYQEKFWGIKTIPNMFISYLLDKKDGKKFSFFARQEERAKIYKDRLFALSVEDIDFITGKAINEAIRPSQQKEKEVVEFLDDLNTLKNLMVENNIKNKIYKTEMDKLKQLVSS